MWERRSILHFSFLLHHWGSRWSLWTFHFCPIILVSTNIIQKLNWVQKYPVLPLLCWDCTCVMLLWQQHRVCVCVCTMVQIVFCSSSVPAGCSALTTYQCVVSPGALCLGWPGFGTPNHHPATVARKPKKTTPPTHSLWIVIPKDPRTQPVQLVFLQSVSLLAN